MQLRNSHLEEMKQQLDTISVFECNAVRRESVLYGINKSNTNLCKHWNLHVFPGLVRIENKINRYTEEMTQ